LKLNFSVFQEIYDKLFNKIRIPGDDEEIRTAFHEAGHLIIALLFKDKGNL